MYASIKSKGRSIGYVIEVCIGKLGKGLFLLFTWLFSILIVTVFADIVVGILNGFDAATGERITANGAVATISPLFVAFAMVLGCFLKHGKCGKLVNILVVIGPLVLVVIFGLTFPVYVPQNVRLISVLLYMIAVHVIPIWALPQLRDCLDNYPLLVMIVGTVLGICAHNPAINPLSFTSFVFTDARGNISYLFPILSATIACGTVFGPHALVSFGIANK